MDKVHSLSHFTVIPSLFHINPRWYLYLHFVNTETATQNSSIMPRVSWQVSKATAPSRSALRTLQTLSKTQHDQDGCQSWGPPAKTATTLPRRLCARRGRRGSLSWRQCGDTEGFPEPEPPRSPRALRWLPLQLSVTASSLCVARCLGSGYRRAWIGSDLRPTLTPSELVAAGGGVQQGLLWRRRSTTSPGAGSAQVCSASGPPSGLRFESVVSGGLRRLNWPVWSLLSHPALYPLPLHPNGNKPAPPTVSWFWRSNEKVFWKLYNSLL